MTLIFGTPRKYQYTDKIPDLAIYFARHGTTIPCTTMHSTLRDAVFLDESVMGHVMAFVPLQFQIAFRATATDQLVTMLCLSPSN